MYLDPLGAVANAIRAHDRFDEVVDYYVENILAWRGELGAFNKIISSRARANMIRDLMFLHFANESCNPDNGASFERLASLCLEREQCGPRVLRTVLVVAEASGYLHTERGRFDKRLKVYQPTEKLMDQMRQWYRHILACLDFLVEDQNFAHCPISDPDFVRRLLLTSGRAFVEQGVVIGEHFPDLQLILGVDGGFATMISVVRASLGGQPSPSHQDIGARFRFSASQTRKILKLAAELELLSFSTDGRIAEASGLVEVCKRYIARELSLYAKYSLKLESHFVEPEPRLLAAPARKAPAMARGG